VAVFIDAPEGLAGILAENAAEAGAGRVDEHQVTGIEQAVLVVNKLVRRCLFVFAVGSNYAARAECAQCKYTERPAQRPLE
jgi:hypothetical protein